MIEKFIALTVVLYPFCLAFYIVLYGVIHTIAEHRRMRAERKVIKENFKQFMDDYRYEQAFKENLKEL